MYEDKKYEAGRVEITSEEYRDLVEEAVEARHDASEMRSEKWKVESERDKLKKELELANKKIAELESSICALQAGYAYIGATPNLGATPNPDYPKPMWSPIPRQANNEEDI